MPSVGDDIQYDGSFLDGSGTPISGLSDVVITVYDHSGSAVATAQACTEIASSGIYRYTLSGASVTGVGDYVGKMSTATSTVPYKTIVMSEPVSSTASVDVQDIVDGVWDEDITLHTTPDSAGETLGSLGSAADPLENPVPGAYNVGSAGYVLGSLTEDVLNVTFASPVINGEDVNIESGDAYKYADGRALVWSSDDWPDLTGATCELSWYTKGKSAAVLTTTGTIVDEGQPTQTVRYDLESDDTTTLSRGRYSVKVRATLASSDVITLVSATGYVNLDD